MQPAKQELCQFFETTHLQGFACIQPDGRPDRVVTIRQQVGKVANRAGAFRIAHAVVTATGRALSWNNGPNAR